MYFGPEEGQYLRGGVVGNLAVCSVFTVLALILALIWGQLNEITYLESLTTMRFPGILMLPVVVTLEGTVASSFGVALYGGNGGSDVFLGVLGLLATSLICAGITALVTAKFFARMKKTDGEASRIEVFLEGTVEWQGIAPHKEFHRYFGKIYEDYKYPLQFFAVVDCWGTFLAGILDALQPSSSTSCFYVMLAVCFLNATIWLLQVSFLPCRSMFGNMAIIVVSSLTTLSAVLVLIGTRSGESSVNDAGVIVSIIGMFVALILTFIAAASEIIAIVQAIRKWWHQREGSLYEEANPANVHVAPPTVAPRDNTDANVPPPLPILAPRDDANVSAIAPRNDTHVPPPLVAVDSRDGPGARRRAASRRPSIRPSPSLHLPVDTELQNMHKQLDRARDAEMVDLDVDLGPVAHPQPAPSQRRAPAVTGVPESFLELSSGQRKTALKFYPNEEDFVTDYIRHLPNPTYDDL